MDRNDNGWRDSLHGVLRRFDREHIVKLKESPPTTRPWPQPPAPVGELADGAIVKPAYKFIERANVMVEQKTAETHAPVSRDMIWLVGLDDATLALLVHPDVIVEVEDKFYACGDAPHWRPAHGWRVMLVPKEKLR